MEAGWDPYAVLGLERGCGEGEVRAAYKRQAMRWHPDKHAGRGTEAEANARFRDVSAAHAVLGVPALRQKWDRGGAEALDEEDLREVVVNPKAMRSVDRMLFSLLGMAGVAVKTEVCEEVLRAAEGGQVEVRTLLFGMPRSDAVGRQKAHFYTLDVPAEEAGEGFCLVARSRDARFKLLAFEPRGGAAAGGGGGAGGGYSLSHWEDSAKEAGGYHQAVLFYGRGTASYNLGPPPDPMQCAEDVEAALFRRLDNMQQRERRPGRAGPGLFAIYGDNFIKPSAYTIEAVGHGATEGAMQTVAKVEAALLRKKGELRDFEAKYRSAQKAYVEAMDRFEDELNAVEGLVRERDGAYRQLGSSSGEIVAGFARGADPQGTKGVLDRLQQKAVRARSRFGKIFR